MTEEESLKKIIEEKKRKELAFIESAKPQLKKWASVNYHRKLLKQWLYSIVGIATGGVLGLVLSHILPFQGGPLLTASEIENLARAFVAPSITMNGLFITFVPVISFFYMAEIKEDERRNEEAFQEDMKEITEENLKALRSLLSLAHAFWHNFRAGILRYTRSYLIVSLLSLFALLILYIALSPAQFVFADILLLATILTGVFPIINVALNKPILDLKESS